MKHKKSKPEPDTKEEDKEDSYEVKTDPIDEEIIVGGDEE